MWIGLIHCMLMIRIATLEQPCNAKLPQPDQSRAPNLGQLLEDSSRCKNSREEAMATEFERPHLQKVPDRETFYSPDILPLLQTTLADLADIDSDYEKNLEAIKHSEADEAHKRELIARLWHQHRERRAPHIHDLAVLRERIEATFP